MYIAGGLNGTERELTGIVFTRNYENTVHTTCANVDGTIGTGTD